MQTSIGGRRSGKSMLLREQMEAALCMGRTVILHTFDQEGKPHACVIYPHPTKVRARA